MVNCDFADVICRAQQQTMKVVATFSQGPWTEISHVFCPRPYLGLVICLAEPAQVAP